MDAQGVVGRTVPTPLVRRDAGLTFEPCDDARPVGLNLRLVFRLLALVQLRRGRLAHFEAVVDRFRKFILVDGHLQSHLRYLLVRRLLVSERDKRAFAPRVHAGVHQRPEVRLFLATVEPPVSRELREPYGCAYREFPERHATHRDRRTDDIQVHAGEWVAQFFDCLHERDDLRARKVGNLHADLFQVGYLFLEKVVGL